MDLIHHGNGGPSSIQDSQEHLKALVKRLRVHPEGSFKVEEVALGGRSGNRAEGAEINCPLGQRGGDRGELTGASSLAMISAR
ncbi:hypothetical protein [Nitratireductor aquibiodomus]